MKSFRKLFAAIVAVMAVIFMHKMHGDIFADIREGTMTVTAVFPQI